MLTTRRNTLADMNRIRNEMHRLFDGWRTSPGMQFAPSLYPPMNLWEDDGNLYIEAELPGLELESLDIHVTGDNQLSVKGERKQPTLEKGKWHRHERGFGAFERVVELPFGVNSEAVEAEFKDGVLTVRLPKREAEKTRRIEVKTN